MSAIELFHVEHSPTESGHVSRETCQRKRASPEWLALFSFRKRFATAMSCQLESLSNAMTTALRGSSPSEKERTPSISATAS